MDLGVVVLLRGLTLRTLVSKPKYSTTTPIRCGYSSVSCNVHDIPRHQRPMHTVQMLHTITPPHCITAGRENVQNDANHIMRIVIGVRNITTMESSMLLHLFFVMVVRLKIVKRERKPSPWLVEGLLLLSCRVFVICNVANP